MGAREKRMIGTVNRLVDAVTELEKLATDNPALVDDRIVVKLHQVGTKLQQVMVNGMLRGAAAKTERASSRLPRLYGGTRPG